MTGLIGTTIAAILTLAIFSFLYKDNPLYRFAERLLVGVSVGYGLGQMYHLAFLDFVIRPLFIDKLYLNLIPIFLGLFYLGFISPKTTWLIRIPISISLGIGSGFSIAYSFQAGIFIQLRETILIFSKPGMNAFEYISAALLVLGVFTTIIYFFFSWEHKGAIGVISRVGIYFLMIGFGASFGLTVMGRISLLIGRFLFLFQDWLKII